MPMILNPLGRLPTEEEAKAQFAKSGIEVVQYEGRPDVPGFSYPHVKVLTADGRVFDCDMLHGGGSMWEEC